MRKMNCSSSARGIVWSAEGHLPLVPCQSRHREASPGNERRTPHGRSHPQFKALQFGGAGATHRPVKGRYLSSARAA